MRSKVGVAKTPADIEDAILDSTRNSKLSFPHALFETLWQFTQILTGSDRAGGAIVLKLYQNMNATITTYDK